MIIVNHYNKWKQIPKQVRSFIFKGIMILLVWKSVYLAFLLPGRALDGPLTSIVGVGTTKALNLFTNSNSFSSKYVIDKFQVRDGVQIEPSVAISIHGKRILTVADACNGLELLVLYVGFIISIPTTRKRELGFIFGGLAAIVLINILRCVGLSLVFLYYPKFGDFSHHFLFKLIVYCCIFCLWLLYSKKLMHEKNI
ncbi:MAG: hypothetical protein NVS9B7_11800 [Flavisolibacter sp.]